MRTPTYEYEKYCLYGNGLNPLRKELYVLFLYWFCLPDRLLDEVITDLDSIYSVGTFVKIHEVQMLENKMVLLVMGHRRWVKVEPVLVSLLLQQYDNKVPGAQIMDETFFLDHFQAHKI